MAINVGAPEGLVTPPTETTKPTEQVSRADAIKTFNSAFDVLRSYTGALQSKDPNSLDSNEKSELWNFKATEAGRALVTGGDKPLEETGVDTFTFKTTDSQSGKEFTFTEGIPMERMLDQLGKYLQGYEAQKALAEQREEPGLVAAYDISIARFNRYKDVLSASGKTYDEMYHPAENPELHRARVEWEAHNGIFKNELAATGTSEGDWFKAEDALKKRIFFMPPEQIDVPTRPDYTMPPVPVRDGVGSTIEQMNKFPLNETVKPPNPIVEKLWKSNANTKKKLFPWPIPIDWKHPVIPLTTGLVTALGMAPHATLGPAVPADIPMPENTHIEIQRPVDASLQKPELVQVQDFGVPIFPENDSSVIGLAQYEFAKLDPAVQAELLKRGSEVTREGKQAELAPDDPIVLDAVRRLEANPEMANEAYDLLIKSIEKRNPGSTKDGKFVLTDGRLLRMDKPADILEKVKGKHLVQGVI